MSDAGKTRSYGPEPWTTTQETVWSHWDLRFCPVARADHDGDGDRGDRERRPALRLRRWLEYGVHPTPREEE